jgi:pimeloyl-ACP methyl ester carboxylesterase
VDLRTHIADVLSCAESEELEDFALVGHSYAGMVITGVADQIGARIASLIYLDALVPDNGQAACDLVSRGLDYSSLPGGMLPAISEYNFGLTDPADIAWIHRRITPQSVRTVTQGIEIRSDLSRLNRSFIECVDHREGQPMMTAIATRARQIARDPSWSHHVLRAGHDCMVSHPAETAALLLKIVGARQGGAGRRA